MDVRAAVWNRLPVEILEQVLSYLLVPDLCRCRTVCKRWNQLIGDPAFGSLCARNASKRDASFIAMRFVAKPYGRRHFTEKPNVSGWCLLDLNARRWYVVKNDPEIRPSLFPTDVDMNGGLVSHWFSGRTIVYNPIAKTRKKLTLPYHSFGFNRPKLNIVVDTISQSFKIFHRESPISKDLENSNSPILRVYDSATNKWKGLSNVPIEIYSGFGHAASVILQGFLYVLLPLMDRLWRYDIGQDSWENLRVHIQGKLEYPELIASTNRLFLKACYGEERLLKVSELKIPDKTHEILFEIPRADVVGSIDLKAGIESRASDMPRISVVGFNDSLMFMSMSTGISAVFDLVTRSWDRGLPRNPLEYLPEDRVLFVGKQMNLVLPSVCGLIAGRSRCR